MKKKWILAIAVVVVVSGLIAANLCLAEDDDDDITSGSIAIAGESLIDLAYDAPVSLIQAVQLAEGETDGRAWSAAIEDENGFLVYDVEVITPEMNVVDFIIDAGTGDILEMDVHEGADDDEENGEEDDDDDDDDDEEEDND